VVEVIGIHPEVEIPSLVSGTEISSTIAVGRERVGVIVILIVAVNSHRIPIGQIAMSAETMIAAVESAILEAKMAGKEIIPPQEAQVDMLLARLRRHQSSRVTDQESRTMNPRGSPLLLLLPQAHPVIHAEIPINRITLGFQERILYDVINLKLLHSQLLPLALTMGLHPQLPRSLLQHSRSLPPPSLLPQR